MSDMDNAHALVVGIANYQQVKRLPPTVTKDAWDIYDLLVDPHYCGYSADNVECLVDEEATLEAMRTALDNLATRCQEDSIAFIYMSCHGGRIESGPQAGEYLLPGDVAVNTDVLPPQIVAATAISGKEFTEALGAIPARKVVVVFDCCHSGGIGEPKSGLGAAFKSGFSDGYYSALKEGRGRAILASSRSTEYSYVLPGGANSLFTRHLLAGIQGGIASDDGLIRIFDLFEYVQPKVTVDHPEQHPIFHAKLEQNFAVALYLGGQKGAILKDADGYRYDVYLSYHDEGEDSNWVWQTLVPRLEQEGLRVAVSGDVEEPGVGRVLGWTRAIEQAKRIVLVLSDRYLEDRIGEVQTALAQWMGIQEGQWRVLPVQYGRMRRALPLNLSFLVVLDVGQPMRGERQFERLVEALKGPVPTM